MSAPAVAALAAASCSTSARSCSTSVHLAAPRDAASKPSAPVPANASTAGPARQVLAQPVEDRLAHPVRRGPQTRRARDRQDGCVSIARRRCAPRDRVHPRRLHGACGLPPRPTGAGAPLRFLPCRKLNRCIRIAADAAAIAPILAQGAWSASTHHHGDHVLRAQHACKGRLDVGHGQAFHAGGPGVEIVQRQAVPGDVGHVVEQLAVAVQPQRKTADQVVLGGLQFLLGRSVGTNRATTSRTSATACAAWSGPGLQAHREGTGMQARARNSCTRCNSGRASRAPAASGATRSRRHRARSCRPSAPENPGRCAGCRAGRSAHGPAPTSKGMFCTDPGCAMGATSAHRRQGGAPGSRRSGASRASNWVTSASACARDTSPTIETLARQRRTVCA